ncbi:MAG: hypothetical protein KTR22_06505, partial [Flavobacteriaceae bacterium]|nr:hypothetical protein [Flavobacteriaceae bacterium]
MKDSIQNNDQNDFSLRELVDKYLRLWYVFVLCVMVAIAGAIIYLRYSTASYMSTATVIVKDDRSASNSGELAAFSELGSFLNRFGDNKIENELAVFRSKRIIKEAVKTLDLNIVYESIGTFKNTNLYEYRPFEVRYLTFNDSVLSTRIPKLNFKILSETSYEVWSDNKSIDETHDFGERVVLGFGDITVLPIFDNPEIFNHY